MYLFFCFPYQHANACDGFKCLLACFCLVRCRLMTSERPAPTRRYHDRQTTSDLAKLPSVMPGQGFGSNLWVVLPCSFRSSTAVAHNTRGYRPCRAELQFWQLSKHAVAPKALPQGSIRPRASSRGKHAWTESSPSCAICSISLPLCLGDARARSM